MKRLTKKKGRTMMVFIREFKKKKKIVPKIFVSFCHRLERDGNKRKCDAQD